MGSPQLCTAALHGQALVIAWADTTRKNNPPAPPCYGQCDRLLGTLWRSMPGLTAGVSEATRATSERSPSIDEDWQFIGNAGKEPAMLALSQRLCYIMTWRCRDAALTAVTDSKGTNGFQAWST